MTLKYDVLYKGKVQYADGFLTVKQAETYIKKLKNIRDNGLYEFEKYVY